MGGMPDTRALIGVDVIASASNPGYHLQRLAGALNTMLGQAFAATGITPDEVLQNEQLGDGALYVLPGNRLGALVDLSDHLDKLAGQHNQWSKPDLRLRIAIDTGPVGDPGGYYSPKIRLARLLDAQRFRALVQRCVDENTDAKGNSAVHSGLIMSDAARQTVFGGDYTSVRENDFVKYEVTTKESTETAWSRVPGVDARTLTDYLADTTDTAELRQETDDRVTHITNTITGQVRNAIQAGVLYGGVHYREE